MNLAPVFRATLPLALVPVVASDARRFSRRCAITSRRCAIGTWTRVVSLAASGSGQTVHWRMKGSLARRTRAIYKQPQLVSQSETRLLVFDARTSITSCSRSATRRRESPTFRQPASGSRRCLFELRRARSTTVARRAEARAIVRVAGFVTGSAVAPQVVRVIGRGMHTSFHASRPGTHANTAQPKFVKETFGRFGSVVWQPRRA